MRAAFFPLFAAVLGGGVTQAQAYDLHAPVVVESRLYSNLPRDAATTPDVNIDRNLIGAEAPASVDVYALTEDLAQDKPVVSIERRVGYAALRPWRPLRAAHGRPVLRVRG